MTVLVLSDEYDFAQEALTTEDLVSVPRQAIPDAELVEACELVVVVGPVTNGDRAISYANVLRLALAQGSTVIFAYRVFADGADEGFLRVLLGSSESLPVGRITGGSHSVTSEGGSFDPAFARYFTRYGQSDLNLTLEGEPIAHINVGNQAWPVAWRIGAAGGQVYVVPFHTASRIAGVVDELVVAVRAHALDAAALVMSFHSELPLPGEVTLRAEISGTRAELAASEEALGELVRWKQLVGAASGQVFERLAIDALNLVLTAQSLRAEDRAELYVEDFWLIDADGADIALAEAKGVNRGIGFADVDQVNAHRSEQDRTTDELPGLLVVNAFRSDDGLERRAEVVSPRVVRHARRQNVLVLRSLDLFHLVARTLSGEDVGGPLIDGVTGGGGWLAVSEDEIMFHTGE